jgi:hypothetical protein
MFEPLEKHCPKGVSDDKCSGNGNRYKCRWYKKETKECWYVGDKKDYDPIIINK